MPGTLVVGKDAPKPRLFALRYDAEALEELGEVEPSALPTLMQPGKLLWLDVQGLGDERILKQIGGHFGLHPLLLEDVVNTPQRPKTEDYESHHFFVTRMVNSEEASPSLEQLSLVLGEGYVLTFQERPGDVLDPVRRRLRHGRGPIRRSGADYLVYALLDTVVDHYQPVIERLGERLERLEDAIIADSDPGASRRLADLRAELLELRRIFVAQRDALGRLARDGSPLLCEQVGVYLRDTHDHCTQAAEAAELYREILMGLMNTYLSVISNRTNDVMRVLTIMTSIFIPLSFLAGLYGMNFDNMPELHSRVAYPVLLGIMLLIASSMLFFFRRRGWLGGNDRP